MVVTQGVYRHHKGGLYTVLFVAKESTNERTGKYTVVYLSHTTGQFHVRELIEFAESVDWPDGFKRPRFVREMQS